MFTLPIDKEIHLQLLMPQDANELISVLKENKDQLSKWLIWALELPSLSDYEKNVIPAWLQKFANNDGFEVGIFYKKELVGMIGLHYIKWQSRSTEIGYWLSETHQGNGIMTRTVRALTDYCFDVLKLNRVLIRVAAQNDKSIAVPTRLGFIKEGITRDAGYIHGSYYDLVNFSLIASDRKTQKC